MVGTAAKDKVGLRELAQQLSVSTATISNAMHRPHLVSPRTRQRILDAAAKAGYVPNQIARALKTRRTQQLGIIAPTLSNPLYTDIVHRAQVAAWQHGLDLVLTSSENWDLDHEIQACRHLMSLQVKGVILVRRTRVKQNEHLRTLLAQNIKVLLLDQAAWLIEGMSGLDVDLVAGTQAAVKHLLELGHQRFMLVMAREAAHPVHAPQQRELGIRLGLRDAGSFEFLPPADPSMQASYDAVSRRLARGDMPTALIASNDQNAIGVMAALRDGGARVPEDFSVVGYDNTEYSQFVRPSLTTVSQTHLGIGERAVEMLLEAIAHPEQPPRKVILTPQLLIRGSTGPVGSWGPRASRFRSHLA